MFTGAERCRVETRILIANLECAEWVCLVRILSVIYYFLLALVAFTSMDNVSMFLTIVVIDLRPQMFKS